MNEHVTSLEHASVIEPVKEESVAEAPMVTSTDVALTRVVPVGPVELSAKSAVELPLSVSVGAVPVKLDVTLMLPVLLAVDEDDEEEEDVAAPFVIVGLNVT